MQDTLHAVNRFVITKEGALRRRVEQEASIFQPNDRKQLARHIRKMEQKATWLEQLLKKPHEDYALGHIPEKCFDLLSA